MGVACGDVDGDGRLDLAVTNFYGESTTLFHNLGQGLFADHTAVAGLAALSRHPLGFGVAFLHADGDGWLDLLTANGHIGDQRPLFPYAMSNRDAVGARVTVPAVGRARVAPRLGGGSLQSASDPRVHFGLGTIDRVEWLEVRWPSGRVDRHRNLASDRGYLLREGEPTARPMRRFTRQMGSARRAGDRPPGADTGGPSP